MWGNGYCGAMAMRGNGYCLLPQELSGSGGSSQDFLYPPPLPSARWRDVSRQPRHCLYAPYAACRP
jgi:hypothetical protein